MSKLNDMTEVDLLACCIYAEARGEPHIGKEAVASVVMNRSKRRKQSVKEVILAPSQFSWTRPGDTNYNRTLAAYNLRTPEFMTCLAVAEQALAGTLIDPTHGADHYLNVALTRILRKGRLPRWAEEGKVTAVIGKHTFLKLEGD